METKPLTNNVLVITLGFYGCGSTVKEAAENCVKAGSSKTLPAVVIVCNKEIKFIDALHVGYPNGRPDFQSEFKVSRVGSLLK